MCIFIISFSYAVHMEPYKDRLLGFTPAGRLKGADVVMKLLGPTPAGRLKGADVVMKLLGLAGLLRRGYHATAFSAQLNWSEGYTTTLHTSRERFDLTGPCLKYVII